MLQCVAVRCSMLQCVADYIFVVVVVVPLFGYHRLCNTCQKVCACVAVCCNLCAVHGLKYMSHEIYIKIESCHESRTVSILSEFVGSAQIRCMRHELYILSRVSSHV